VEKDIEKNMIDPDLRNQPPITQIVTDFGWMALTGAKRKADPFQRIGLFRANS